VPARHPDTGDSMGRFRAAESAKPRGSAVGPTGGSPEIAQLKRFTIALIVAATGMSFFAGCGGSKTTTVIESSTPGVPSASTSTGTAGTPAATTPADTTPTDSNPADTAAAARPQVFHGSGQQNLGTITAPSDTTISWNCPSCGNTNFIINNAKSDANPIPTNGLDQTQGVDPLPAGVYHTVVVDTTGGPWTVAIGTTAQNPSRSNAGASQASGLTSAQPPSTNQGSFSQCDANVSVVNGECYFAENTFYEYWMHHGASTFSVYSPADRSPFTVTCSAGSEISCTATQGTTVQFSQSSIDAYTQSQADGYASSHNLGP
jgi:hypothetical protein